MRGFFISALSMKYKRTRNTLGPIIGYHGCDRAVAEKVLTNEAHLNPSENDYDWLGHGIYFWIDSPERGLQWGIEQEKRGKIKDPYVIGAYIHPGLCLNLTDYGVMEEVLFAHDKYKKMVSLLNKDPKKNMSKNGILLFRNLDCAVINTLHTLRLDTEAPPYDTVYGVFEEGAPLYKGAGFKKKTHIQVAVRNIECIIGYFRVPGQG